MKTVNLFADLELHADELSAFGQEPTATAVRETIRRACEARRAYWNAPLAVPEAAEWGGYSASQLRRLVSDNIVAVAPDGKIRRRHVPVKPGHVIPLGLDPMESSETNWRERIRQQRETS